MILLPNSLTIVKTIGLTWLQDCSREVESNLSPATLSHKKRKPPKRMHRKKINPYGTATMEGLSCPARKNLAVFLRFNAKEGTGAAKKPSPVRRKCAFCGKERTFHSCAGCKQFFCMSPPVYLTIPLSDPPKKFPKNGPFCWHRLHGFDNFSKMNWSLNLYVKLFFRFCFICEIRLPIV